MPSDPSNITATDLINIYGNDPMNGVINDIKSITGKTGQEYIRKEDVQKAADLVRNQDPAKAAVFDWIVAHFKQIDGVKHDWTNGNGNWGSTNGNDGWIGGGDLQKYFGW
jgi:hypothetical protein